MDKGQRDIKEYSVYTQQALWDYGTVEYTDEWTKLKTEKVSWKYLGEKRSCKP